MPPTVPTRGGDRAQARKFASVHEGTRWSRLASRESRCPSGFFLFFLSLLSPCCQDKLFSSSSQNTLSIIISSKSFQVLVCLIVVLLYTLSSHSFFSSPTFSSLPRGFPECLSTREVSLASLVILIVLNWNVSIRDHQII